MAQWMVVAEVFTEMGYTAAVPHYVVLADIEGSRDDALAELARQAETADQRGFPPLKHRVVYRSGDTYILANRRSLEKSPQPFTRPPFLTVWEKVGER
jgi:hypothetical protein